MNASTVPHQTQPNKEANKAQLCLLLNVAATPGLGSLVARCWIVGSLQLLMAVTGFVFIMMWYFELFRSLIQEGVVSASSNSWKWQTGLILFGTAWIWGLITGLTRCRVSRKLLRPPVL